MTIGFQGPDVPDNLRNVRWDSVAKTYGSGHAALKDCLGVHEVHAVWDMARRIVTLDLLKRISTRAIGRLNKRYVTNLRSRVGSKQLMGALTSLAYLKFATQR